MANKKAAPAKVKGKEKTKEKPKAEPAKAKPAVKSTRLSWLDAETGAPVIDKYARQLESFLDTMADGIVEASEIQAQEKRLTKLMKEVEPELNDDLHGKVTKLLCELTAYDLMQTFFAMQQARPKSIFRG